MTGLTYLDLDDNAVTNLAPIAGAAGMKELYLVHNDIGDISALSGMSQLTRLELKDNRVADLSALAGKTEITRLYLSRNLITDLSPISDSTAMQVLDVSTNDIVSVAALAGMTQLQELYLHQNSITDLSPLEGCTQLWGLVLAANPISDIAPLSGLTQLTWLDLTALRDRQPRPPDRAAPNGVPLSGHQSHCRSFPAGGQYRSWRRRRARRGLQSPQCGQPRRKHPHAGGTRGDGRCLSRGLCLRTPKGKAKGPIPWTRASLTVLKPVDTGDTDGDGLSDCEESCRGTSVCSIDSDGDSIPDGFEVGTGLDPLVDDAEEDPDHDGLTNIEEFMRASLPLDPTSPYGVVFVAPNGLDLPERGAEDQPYATLGYALAQIAPTQSASMRIIVVAGDYPEDVEFKDYTTISSEDDALPARIIGTVTGANHAALEYIEVTASEPDAVLVDINDVSMTLRGVTLRGDETGTGTGALVDGAAPAEGAVENCLFTDLSVGIDVAGLFPMMRRNVFERFKDAAVVIRPTTLKQAAHGLGDSTLAPCGWNTFRDANGGSAVVNEREEEIKMEENDWGTDDAEEIATMIEGPGDFEPYLAKGTGILAASVYCILWDNTTQERVFTATAGLSPSAYAPVTVNEQGVYAFPAVMGGAYTLDISAPGYLPRGRKRACGSRLLRLRANPAVSGDGRRSGISGRGRSGGRRRREKPPGSVCRMRPERRGGSSPRTQHRRYAVGILARGYVVGRGEAQRDYRNSRMTAELSKAPHPASTASLSNSR